MRRRKSNILIVDDLPEKLLVFQTILEELDQNLVMVRSGSEALREVLEREFAVILLDVNMPDIDGLETARLIRQYKKSAHTPIIFITAYADEMQTAQGYSLGAVDYILSPVMPDVLRSKVRVFVELYQMQQRTRAMAGEQVARARAEAAQDRGGRDHAPLQLPRAREPRARRLARPRAGHAPPARAGGAAARRRRRAGGRRRGRGAAGLSANGKQRTAAHARCRPTASCPRTCARALQRVVREGLPLEGETVCYPLRIGERTLGALALASDGSRRLLPRDLVTLQELVSRAAIALDNARLYSSLQREIVRSRQAEESLQDANRRKDEFLAMLSHELRNPLAPIRNAVEVIRRARAARPEAHHGARRGRPPGDAARAPGGGAARRVAHQPGQDRAQEGAGRPRRASSRTASRPRGR